MNLNTLKESFKDGQDKIKKMMAGAALFGALTGVTACSSEGVKQEKVSDKIEQTQTPEAPIAQDVDSMAPIQEKDLAKGNQNEVANLDEALKAAEANGTVHDPMKEIAKMKKDREEVDREIADSRKSRELDVQNNEAKIMERDVEDIKDPLFVNIVLKHEQDLKEFNKPINEKMEKLINTAHKFKKENPHLFSK